MENDNNVIATCYVVINKNNRVEPTIYLFDPIDLISIEEKSIMFETVFEAKTYITEHVRADVPIDIAS